MKRITPLKLSCAGACLVAALGVGCASSGTAQHNASSEPSVGVAASADTGTDRDVRIASSTETYTEPVGETVMTTPKTTETWETDQSGSLMEGDGRITASTLSFAPETRASWVNRFPFYDQNVRTIEPYLFGPDQVIRHGPNPR